MEVVRQAQAGLGTRCFRRKVPCGMPELGSRGSSTVKASDAVK